MIVGLTFGRLLAHTYSMASMVQALLPVTRGGATRVSVMGLISPSSLDTRTIVFWCCLVFLTKPVGYTVRLRRNAVLPRWLLSRAACTGNYRRWVPLGRPSMLGGPALADYASPADWPSHAAHGAVYPGPVPNTSASRCSRLAYLSLCLLFPFTLTVSTAP